MKFSQISATLLRGLLFVGLAIPAGAQSGSSPRIGRGFGPAYDATHEATLVGTVEQVAVNHETDSLAGVHMLIAGDQGSVDAYLGPFLGKQAKETLPAGASVQLVGSTMQFHGKDYFLVRELSAGGHTVVVRTQRGFLVARGEIRTADANKTLVSQPKGGR